MLTSPWDRLDRTLVRSALAPSPNLSEEPAGRTAAVCVLLVALADGVQVLLIQRARREGDPWSGHMAMPGGFRAPSDASLYATAVRETFEEVAIDLERDAELLGCLTDVSPALGDLVVRPFVFARDGLPEVVTNHEVQDVTWAPVAALARGDAPAFYEVKVGSSRRTYPGFRIGEQVVWGMTYRVLVELVERTRRTLAASDGPRR